MPPEGELVLLGGLELLTGVVDGQRVFLGSALGSDFSGLGGTATLGEGSRKKGWRLTSPCPLDPRASDTGPG